MDYRESEGEAANKNLYNVDFIIEITKNQKSFTGIAKYRDRDIHPSLKTNE